MALYEIITPKPAIRLPSIAGAILALKSRLAAQIARERETRALRAMPDRDLSDLAIGRSEIEYAVRHGR